MKSPNAERDLVPEGGPLWGGRTLHQNESQGLKSPPATVSEKALRLRCARVPPSAVRPRGAGGANPLPFLVSGFCGQGAPRGGVQADTHGHGL